MKIKKSIKVEQYLQKHNVATLAKVRWYRIVPQKMYFIDNSFGLGNRDEIELSDKISSVSLCQTSLSN